MPSHERAGGSESVRDFKCELAGPVDHDTATVKIYPSKKVLTLRFSFNDDFLKSGGSIEDAENCDLQMRLVLPHDLWEDAKSKGEVWLPVVKIREGVVATRNEEEYYIPGLADYKVFGVENEEELEKVAMLAAKAILEDFRKRKFRK